MNLEILPVIRESMGFAAHKFETVARLAWFPLVLVFLFLLMFPYLQLTILTGELVTVHEMPLVKARALFAKGATGFWQEQPGKMAGLLVFYYVFIMMMYASFVVPLLRLSARGIPVTHRSLVLLFSPRHVKFLAFSLLAAAGIGLVTVLPLTLINNYVSSYVITAMQTQYAVFPDVQSLHMVRLESALTDPAPFEVFLKSLAGVVGLVMLYFSIRLFAAPVFAAVREKPDQYNSFVQSWRLTKGWNTFWVALAGVVLAGTVCFVTVALNGVALPMILSTIGAIYKLFSEIAGLELSTAPDKASMLALLRWVWVMINMIANMIWMFFLTGTAVGLGGALYRRMPG